MRRLVLAAAMAVACQAEAARAADFAVGADVSFLRQAEARGVQFREGGETRPGLRILKDHGYSWVRLRLFHTPTDLPNDLEYTLAAAKEARELGFRLLLDLHYSDTWADPGKQYIPRAWEGKSHEELVQAVFEYTRDTLSTFREAGVPPDVVQIGNEVSAGMLWPDGRLPERWDQFAELLKAGTRGVEAGRGDGPRPRVMVHFDKGGNRAATRWFYDGLQERGVEFDLIGLSYYPWWHGSLLDLRENLDFVAGEYGKDVMLVEVAYCWRPSEYRRRPGPFPETPQGQREFLEEVARVALAARDRRVVGVFWWEPAVDGPLRRRGFFDDDGEALPVLQAFDRYTRH